MAVITRRGLITGLGTLLCAPAIVRASSIMPVKAWHEDVLFKCTEYWLPMQIDPRGFFGSYPDVVVMENEIREARAHFEELRRRGLEVLGMEVGALR